MVGILNIDPAGVRAAAEWLDRAAQDLADEVSAHMRLVREFLGSDWQGDAAGSHETPWTDWESGAHRLLTSFRTDAELLRRVAAEHAQTDQHRAQAITQAGPGLDLPGVF
ncbi:WXG100 family type VII secretion target [Nocardia tengchongensis]|uniref:WXG100 family type VII secretion target n=1 Tax=Nocardia tengchongensis TaxID=2055889 RepID=UPI00368134C9